MRRIFLLIFIFIMTYETSLSAENKYTFSQFGSETVDFVLQPLKWRGDDYLTIGLICAGTGLTMFADQPIQKAVISDGKFDANGLNVSDVEYSDDKSRLLICDEKAHHMYIYEQPSGKITSLGTGYYPRWNATYDGVIYTKNGNPFYRGQKGAFEKNIKTLKEKAIPFYPEAYSPDRAYYLHYKTPFWYNPLKYEEPVNIYVSPSKAIDNKSDTYIGGPFYYPRECIWIAE